MLLKRISVTTANNSKTNCYIIADEYTKEAMVIDPGGEPEKIITMLEVLDVKLKYIVLTHCHGDHIGAAPEIKKTKGGKILIHRLESESVNDRNINLVEYVGMNDDIKIDVDARLDDEDLIHIGEIAFKVIHTPGHTRGSICLYCAQEKLLISGDTLFNGTWGRTDLPTSNFEDIIASITNRLMILPEETIVYPGHGKPTMIREEENVYLNLKPKKY